MPQYIPIWEYVKLPVLSRPEESGNLTCKMQVKIATLNLCKRKRRPRAVPDAL
jgi:hypothetical protein